MSRYSRYDDYGDWAPYVPVAQRRSNAIKHATDVAKKEKRTVAPVTIEGRKIAKSFWGNAWCDNLTQYSDYANRLPRGGTYVRNGSVVDLQINKGTIQAIVAGSEPYTITIKIDTLPDSTWSQIKQECSRSIDTLLDLVQGKFDRGIMERLTRKEGGLFPQPKEIKFRCSCPDSAGMCKHIAATMYGVGHRLDSSPELLFQLRGVDHLELVGQAVTAENLDRSLSNGESNQLAGSDLGELFGIELDPTIAVPEALHGKLVGTPSKKTDSQPKKKKTVKKASKGTPSESVLDLQTRTDIQPLEKLPRKKAIPKKSAKAKKVAVSAAILKRVNAATANTGKTKAVKAKRTKAYGKKKLASSSKKEA